MRGILRIDSRTLLMQLIFFHLTTGIDVNIKLRRISNFEFTPECAIFDMLDIPLYHGWIVDPQDKETADALGSKSYNAIMEWLVAPETRSLKTERQITQKMILLILLGNNCNFRSSLTLPLEI